MKMIDIKINGISKKYNKQLVLKDVSIEINNDSYYAICGKSGAGKSTFMNILGLIESFDKGEYVFNGQKIKNNKDYCKIRQGYIGFIYQSYNLIPRMNCRENILMPLIYANVRRTEVKDDFDRIVKMLQIARLLDKESSVLSGGEKQRVAIARALILNPGLIIADEPTGNLDEENKCIVMDILKNEHKKGRAIVVITHDEYISMEAEKIYVLQNGKLL